MLRKLILLLATSFSAGSAQVATVHTPSLSKARFALQVLSPRDFQTPNSGGWSIEIGVNRSALQPGTPLVRFTGAKSETWLAGGLEEVDGEPQVSFHLYTDYRPVPLTVGVPLKLLAAEPHLSFLLRYSTYRLSLFCNGVLVDEEWPAGVVKTGDKPLLTAVQGATIRVWNSPLSYASITSRYGGGARIKQRTNRILGPEPRLIQYSRPRGWDEYAGDAMPFYHDGTFHLFYLLDRRHHKSKWGLGAHEWVHISSSDLIHWKQYPTALAIDHEWEGSMCTGSVFFDAGKYYAFYATRRPEDRSERLGVAISDDAIHFAKTLPTPFAEPAPPFVHGPNRDPFVFRDGGKFHMLVTAAVPSDSEKKTEGALEHLVSDNLLDWKVQKEPFFLPESSFQPECSDLFKWGDWYYLIYSLAGTTHYRVSKSAMGPWAKPVVDILDGPETIVMKAAQFHDNRYLLVGFLQYNNKYAGDLIFRELTQEKDGTLGTKTPREMDLSAMAERALPNFHLKADEQLSAPLDLEGDSQLKAHVSSQSAFAIEFGAPDPKGNLERLVFDPAAESVVWMDAAGVVERATLEHVSSLDNGADINLVLHGTLADLTIGGHRTMVHRLTSPSHVLTFASLGKAVDGTSITISRLH